MKVFNWIVRLHFLVSGWDEQIVILEIYSACGLYNVFVAMWRCGGGHGASPTVSWREIGCARNELKLWEIGICRPVHNTLVSLLTAASRLHRYVQTTKDDGRYLTLGNASKVPRVMNRRVRAALGR